VKHLAVPESHRRKGIGSLALAEALGRIRTPLACATIRAGNAASLALFKKQGLRPAERFEKDNGKVVLMIRAIRIAGPAQKAPGEAPP
jgi:GNAT superfamily N-acetyltransferase